MEHFLDEHKKFIKLLQKHNVLFILIGGYAVIYHGYGRTTGDMDLWLQPTNENKQKLLLALKDFGIVTDDLTRLEALDFIQTLAFHIGKEPNKIEFLTKIQSVKFEDAYAMRIDFQYEDIKVPILHYNHLIESKILSNRPKDKADVDELQRINQHRKNPL